MEVYNQIDHLVDYMIGMGWSKSDVANALVGLGISEHHVGAIVERGKKRNMSRR